MADDTPFKPNKNTEGAIWAFVEKYKDPGSWGDCGYVVVEPQEKFANLSLVDIRKSEFKIKASGEDPFQAQPKRLKSKS